MGETVRQLSDPAVTEAAVRERLGRSIVALTRMIDDGFFDSVAETCGFEVELDLVDSLGRPRQVNEPVLAAMNRRDFQPELSRFNMELNLDARPIRGRLFSDLDQELAATLDAAQAVSNRHGANVIAIGTLPTLHDEDLTARHLSASPRYPLLDAAMAALRGHEIRLDIRGVEHLRLQTDSIALQAAATSFQVHVRTAPKEFARYYNAAMAIAAAQVASGANSAFLLGRHLWSETRIALIEQSLDLRRAGRRSRERAPRVWAGDRWASTPVDVLADNVRRYRPLIRLLDPEDPLDEVAGGRVPGLRELRLHNGTIWRWNRPVYDVQHGHPHLRIENRVLPSGPSAVDMVANAAFFLGLVRAVADHDPPVSRNMTLELVTRDLHEAARLGLDAELHWPVEGGLLVQTAQRLILEHLLPLASSGLDAWAVDPRDRDRYLGVIESRVRTGRTGARWQTATVAALEASGAHRELALREMVRRYVEHLRTREPVHTWPTR